MSSSTSPHRKTMKGPRPSGARRLPLSDDTNSDDSSDTSRSSTPAQPEAHSQNVHLPLQVSNKRKHRKRKGMGLNSRPSRVERGNDAFDYEQKFAEDDPFKEMGPMARVWKTFLEEYAKFDSDRVEDWRDALDVLLVFAGLFSAVVSTFVTQTSPNLQVDYNQVTAYLVYDMLRLQQAMMDGLPPAPSPPQASLRPLP
ncbi:hypothetical protein BDZ89DRAFT_601670 [Hymenopellis radicata]|nr:hypothetical protein BDZ89DRAFT_601670 [Hymenopellis radicata]